ncbi:MAG: hypothetical protein WED08_02675 [Patescibacteria group bacterium]
MNRNFVLVFLVVALLTAAVLATLGLLGREMKPAVLEYSQIREIATESCTETDLGFDRYGNIADPAGLSTYTFELMRRAGYDDTPWFYSHVGNSYVEGTEYCWLVAFSKPGDQSWTVLYEDRDGVVRELFARVH